MRNSGLKVIYFQEVSESLLQVMNNTMYDYSQVHNKFIQCTSGKKSFPPSKIVAPEWES